MKEALEDPVVHLIAITTLLIVGLMLAGAFLPDAVVTFAADVFAGTDLLDWLSAALLGIALLAFFFTALALGFVAYLQYAARDIREILGISRRY